MAARLYRREAYLDKVRPFVDDTGIIKVVTGIRRCGKSCLMKTVTEEIIERGTPTENIVFIDLEKRGLRRIKTPDQLEATIEEHIPSKIKGTIYLFIDDVGHYLFKGGPVAYFVARTDVLVDNLSDNLFNVAYFCLWGIVLKSLRKAAVVQKLAK